MAERLRNPGARRGAGAAGREKESIAIDCPGFPRTQQESVTSVEPKASSIPVREERSRTPAVLASFSRQSIMVREESVTGNMRPSGSVLRRTPRASNQAIVSAGENRCSGEMRARSPRRG